MTSPAETFAIELGRVSKRSRRFLRGLKREDRDDAVAAAILACWERREQFDQAVQPLEDWFKDVLQSTARSVLRANRAPNYAALKLAEIAAPEDTARNAELQMIAENLTEIEQRVASMLAEGYSLNRIATDIEMTRSELKKVIRKLKTFSGSQSVAIREEPTYSRSDNDLRHKAQIDHDIERLLRRPATERADCPVCWKCFWFEGLTPTHYHPPQLADLDVCAAVAATEARKIKIGNGESAC
jgi:DNA-directed RNA polymerase specialized sigma24 family protein